MYSSRHTPPRRRHQKKNIYISHGQRRVERYASLAGHGLHYVIQQLLDHKFIDSLFFFAADQVAEYKDAFAVFDREGDGKDILTSK